MLKPEADLCCVHSSQLVDHQGSTIQVMLSTGNTHNGFVTSNSISCVSRKFVERDRVVFVSVSLTEPSVKDHLAVDGVKFLTTTVRMLKRGNVMPDGSRATVLESFWSTKGYDVDGVSKCPGWKLEPFLALGIGAMEAAMVREQGAMEDLLLQAAVGGQSASLNV